MLTRFPTFLAALLMLACPLGVGADDDEADSAPVKSGKSLWVDGIGSGYVKRARFIDIEFTRGFGSTDYGGIVAHDLMLGRLSFSQSFNDVWSVDRWYGGNLFWTVEFMGGLQDNPDQQYLAFGNFGLRYEFATRGRFIPYVDAALGAGATGISEPDLSEGIQFSQQVGVGLRYFLNDHWNLTAAAGYMHISNGGYKKPNGGVNSYMLSLGVGWGF